VKGNDSFKLPYRVGNERKADASKADASKADERKHEAPRNGT
jgi:hypothetical protein